MHSRIVTLYGHLTVDRIIIDFKERNTLGGICNVWYALRQLNGNIEIKIKPTSVGEAIILVDKESNQRISKACLNLKYKSPDIEKSSWSHIAYINQIKELDFISNINGIISADITKENPNNVLPYLSYIDYLFISESDLFMPEKELFKLIKNSLIVHNPNGSILYTKNDIFEYFLPEHLFLNNINVLGAGDYLAAGFISNMMKGMDLKNSISKAHEFTTFFLKDNIL